MTIQDIMKYIESEYNVINSTPCEICGGAYLAEELGLELVEDRAYDICECICEKCGHEKIFEFYAPFITEKNSKDIKKKMN